MSEPLRFALHNPLQLEETSFRAGFVARLPIFEELMGRLRRMEDGRPARHQLILGQRGMGKTTLLRRLALGIQDDPALQERYLPLSFREEQYNVTSLGKFWMNCLDALGDALEQAGWTQEAESVDQDLARLARGPLDPMGQEAYESLRRHTRRRRPVLLVDNLVLVLDGLSRDAQAGWALRRALQDIRGPLLVGASVAGMEIADQSDAPFYDFFQITVLSPLQHPEMRTALGALADLRGEAGQRVRTLLAQDPGRIQVLHELTGGNPRTLTLLYLLLESDGTGTVMQDLEAILDRVSPLYKARVEELPLQARAVLDAVALAWAPVTAAETAHTAGLEVTVVSSQLDRLLKAGLLEKVTLGRRTRTGFRLAERFFNIWYLMRHGSRSQRMRLRWLAEFLRHFYTSDQLKTQALHLLSSDPSDLLGTSTLCTADQGALSDPLLQELLSHQATRILEQHAQRVGEPITQFANEEDLHDGAHTMAEFRRLALECSRDWGESSAEEFLDLVGGGPIDCGAKLDLARKLQDVDLSTLTDILETAKKTNESLVVFLGSNELVTLLQNCLREGRIRDLEDLQGALASAQFHQEPRLVVPVAILGEKTIVGKDWEHLLQALRSASELDLPVSTSCRIQRKIASICQQMGDLAEAEMILRKIIALDPASALHHSLLGNLLMNSTERYSEARSAFMTALERDETNSEAMTGLALLAVREKQDLPEAERQLKLAIAKHPDDGMIRWMLATLLWILPERWAEAEASAREATQLAPKIPHTWQALGDLLWLRSSDLPGAEAAFRRVLELEPNHPEASASLALFLATQYPVDRSKSTAARRLMKGQPTTAQALLKVVLAITKENLGEAFASLSGILDTWLESRTVREEDLLLQVFRFAKAQGAGPRLLAWMDEQGYGDRYWPQRAALDAFLNGEPTLRDLPPEVAGVAERLYRRMQPPASEAEEAAPRAKGRRRGSR